MLGEGKVIEERRKGRERERERVITRKKTYPSSST